MKIVLGADHGGFEIKESIKEWLSQSGYDVDDVGAFEFSGEDDYVDFAVRVAEKVRTSTDKGLLFCRNGMGMMIVANRFSGIRCGLGFDTLAVKKGRMDDDINILSIPSDYVDTEKVKEMIVAFLAEEFSGMEKYKRRILKLDNI